MDIKKDILTRVGIIYILVSIFALAVMAKIVHVQFFDENIEAKIEKQENKENVEPPKRGDIYSRDGKLLACSVPKYRIGFHYKSYKKGDTLFQNNANKLASSLAEIYDSIAKANNSTSKSKKYYLDKLYRAKKLYEDDPQKRRGLQYFAPYKVLVDYNTKEQIKKLPILEYGRFKGGLHIEDTSIRVYPYGGIALRTIGRIQNGHGYRGIEKYYDQYLYGIEPADNYFSDENSRGIDGYDVITTLDSEMQLIADEELRNALEKYKAEWGCVVIMDVKSGEILALSNLAEITKNNDTIYFDNKNYAVTEICDPGSTIKLASLIIALEDNVVDLDDTVDTKNGITRFYDKNIVDWNHKTHGGFGRLSVKDVFAKSSNVGVTKIIHANYVTTNREWDYIERLKSMSLDKPSGIDLANEPTPMVKDPSVKLSKENINGWDQLSLLQMSYGYSIGLTPLQILNFFNAIANDGKMVRPHLVRKVQSDRQVILDVKSEVTNSSVCSKTTLAKAKIMLEEVVTTGTSKSIKNKYYKIAGKTGTAQTYVPGKGYEAKLRGSFCGYFPADQPKYSMIVVIQSSSPYDPYSVGGGAISKIFKKISDRIYFTDHELRNQLSVDSGKVVVNPEINKGYTKDYEDALGKLGIPYSDFPASAWTNTNSANKTITGKAINLDDDLVPDFRGMGLRDALFLAENLGLKTEIVGVGKIYRQSIKASKKITKGETIVLELR